MAVSCPGNCFISYTQEILFEYTGAERGNRGIGTWSYRHNVIYVKPRRTKDRLKYNMQKPALLRPILHIGTTSIIILLKIAEDCGSKFTGEYARGAKLGLYIFDWASTSTTITLRPWRVNIINKTYIFALYARPDLHHLNSIPIGLSVSDANNSCFHDHPVDFP